MNRVLRQDLTVRDRFGMHLRVAAEVVRICARHAAAVTLEYDAQRADGRSVLQLCTLGVPAGGRVQVSAEGGDAHLVLQRLAEHLQPDVPLTASVLPWQQTLPAACPPAWQTGEIARHEAP